MVGGGYYVITGHWSHEVALLGLAYALGPTAVLFGKHIDKLDADGAKGIRTLPVLLGERASRHAVMAMLVAQLLLIAGLVASGAFHPAVLVVLLAAPSLRRVHEVYRAPRPSAPPNELAARTWPLWFVGAAFWYNRRFAGLLVLGLLADLAFGAL
jgi:1,4-dihydroxy-2-naphthoate octaprenyltransferase